MTATSHSPTSPSSYPIGLNARPGYSAKAARLSDTQLQMVVDVEPGSGNPGARHTFNLTMLPGQDIAELCRGAYPIAFEGAIV